MSFIQFSRFEGKSRSFMTYFQKELSERREQLFAGLDSTNDEFVWKRRAYPVLSVLAPAVSKHKNKVEFPGDPVCLYHALGKVISDCVAIRSACSSDGNRFNDFCPYWDSYPSLNYRRKVGPQGVRSQQERRDSKTDGSVFDPRIWNESVAEYFHTILDETRPRVVLISTVSPAYRFAADILKIVKKMLPNCVTILGGRHIDATLTPEINGRGLNASASNPLVDIQNGHLEPNIDLMLSGECYYSLSIVMQAISLTIPVDSSESEIGFPDASKIQLRLEQLLASGVEKRGRSFAVLLSSDAPFAFDLSGPPIDPLTLPSPYDAFAIRARFPIFKDSNGVTKVTGHVNTLSQCPFACEFCSESRLISIGTAVRLTEKRTVDEVCKLISYGAEAVFFDDSVFFSGSSRRITEFCQLLANEDFEPLKDSKHSGRFSIEWGAQFTVSVIESYVRAGIAEKILDEMRAAGCTYIYFGLESLSGKVMDNIQKTTRNQGDSWLVRVRKVLSTVKASGIRAGASILFGLEGETMDTIEETIGSVETLLEEELLAVVSPNLMTYHPGTEITSRHNRESRLSLQYATLGDFVREPYSFFEEAFPGMVSQVLTEELIWHIHDHTLHRWGKGRNSNAMEILVLPED